MPNVTVLGSSGTAGHNAIWTIPYSASANSTLAQNLANQITAGILNSSIATQMWGSADPTPPGPMALDIGGTAANLFNGAAISTSVAMTSNMLAVIDNSTLPVTVDGIGNPTPVTVIAGQGGLTFNSGISATGVGSGFIVDGGHVNNLISIDQTTIGGGGYWVSVGDGASTVLAGGGNNTITGAYGAHNLVDVSGYGNNVIALGGADTVTASSGAGSDTVGIGVSNGDSLLISMSSNWTGKLTFGDTATVGGGSAISVMGGGGSVTLFGGLHQDVFFGGTAGNNFIVGGSDPTSSITGGGNGDQLFAGYYGGGVIQAGIGNETLVGAGRPGINGAADPAGTLFFGNTLTGGANIFTGAGADTVTAGAGQETFHGDPTGKSDFFSFSASITGAAKAEGAPTNAIIYDFTVGKDTVALSNYGYTSASQVAADVTQSGGNSTLQLNDGTKIEFANVTNLTSKNFQI